MITTFLDPYVFNALMGGWAVALSAGPLGVFVLWRRLGFLGDTLAHSAFLGVSISLLLNIPHDLGTLGVSLILGLTLGGLLLGKKTQGGGDQWLGILSHGSLAVALVLASLYDMQIQEINTYLFGDILAIDTLDILYLGIGSLFVLGFLGIFWKPLVAMTVSQDLAEVDGYPVKILNLIFMGVLAAVIALSLKFAGALLIGALLLLPATIARPYVKTPKAMAVGAVIVGGGMVTAGTLGAVYYNTPVGPTIVVAGLIALAVSHLLLGRAILKKV